MSIAKKAAAERRKVMSNEVHILREAVIKITQMLTGQGLQVTQKGVTAEVIVDKHTGKPRAINLPYIPDNATPELVAAIQGFLDKEVSGVMFTDYDQMKTIAGNKPLTDMVKIVEGARVEHEMGRRFRGSASNLADVADFFLRKHTDKKLEEAVIARDNEAAEAVLQYPMLRSLCGLHVDKAYMSAKTSIVQDQYDKIKHLESKLTACSSTAEAIMLTKEVRRLLEMEDPEEGEGGGSGGAGGGGGAGGFGRSKGGGGSGSAGEEEGEEEGESGEVAGEENFDDVSEDSTTDGKSGYHLEASDKENANNFSNAMSSIITGDTVDTAKTVEYLVYSRSNDVIENLHIGKEYKHSMFTEEIQDKVDHMVGPLQKDLERAITARSLAQWENGRRRGRLHSANLVRLATGDDRVFRRKIESETKDVAFSLVIDMSGSMHGGKITVATQAAYALSSVLERLRINHEVICFTTDDIPGGDAKRMHAEEKMMGRSYSRQESLYMPVLKNFGERFGAPVNARFGWLPNTRSMRNNVDGESVEIAVRRLMAQKQTGKAMIVLSDGQPAGAGDNKALRNHLKDVVKRSTALGVNMVGIGINSDAVAEYYPKHVVLRDIKDLPSQVIKELRALLLK